MSEWEDIKARLSVGFMGHVSDGSCKAEKPCMGCDIRAALEEIEQGRKARVALQEALGSHNVENPWLGICAAVALLQMGRNKLAEANRNAEAERSATWARLDKAEAEVARLREALEDISRLHPYGVKGCDPNVQWCGCAGCVARAVSTGRLRATLKEIPPYWEAEANPKRGDEAE